MLNRRGFIGALGAALPVAAAPTPIVRGPTQPSLQEDVTINRSQKRLAIYSVSSDFLHELIQYMAMDPADREALRIYGLPDGARFVRAHYEWRVDAFHLVFWHPSFAIVPDAAEIPQLRFVQTRLNNYTPKPNGMTISKEGEPVNLSGGPAFGAMTSVNIDDEDDLTFRIEKVVRQTVRTARAQGFRRCSFSLCLHDLKS